MNKTCNTVVFSNRAYNAIILESFAKNPVETGGILLGYILDNSIWVVMEVLPPGKNSIFQIAYFEYDTEFVNYLAQSVASQYKVDLVLLGLWHRHPNSMDTFSSTDDETNKLYASLNTRGAISGLVNIDPKFRLTMYHVNYPCNYSKVETMIGDDLIPSDFFDLKYSLKENINPLPLPLIHDNKQALNKKLNIFNDIVDRFYSKKEKTEKYWFDFDKNRYKRELKSIKRVYPNVEFTIKEGNLSVHIRRSDKWNLKLIYMNKYFNETPELRTYISNDLLQYPLPYIEEVQPYIVIDQNGDPYLSISEIIKEKNISALKAIEFSNEWIDLYNSLLHNQITINEFKIRLK